MRPVQEIISQTNSLSKIHDNSVRSLFSQFDPKSDELAEELAKSLTAANDSYRSGAPVITDKEYDSAVEIYAGMVSPEQAAAFVRLMTEPGGEVKHQYLVGSLKKVKFGEGQLAAWLKKLSVGEKLLLQAKVDGMSYVAKYVNGIMISGASRGDGFSGISLSNQLAWILPAKLNKPVTLDVRGELALTGDDHVDMGFKNRRNGVVGLLGRDNSAISDLQKVKAFTYQIKAGYMADAPVYDQIVELEALGFQTPAYLPELPFSEYSEAHLEATLAEILAGFKDSEPYSIDGLVLSSMTYCIEDAFLPEMMVAFKVNAEAVPTTVLGIEWNTTKNGRVVPVILIQPVEIDGTTVSRVTGYNAQWISDMGIGVGAVANVVKSGDVIPKINEVCQVVTVVLIDECPSCQALLDKVGVDLVCSNKFCSAASLKTVESFLIKMDVDGAKATTLENLNITTLSDLLSWTPDPSYKGQTNLYAELGSKVFNAPADQLFSALVFDGFGRKMVNKLIEFYGSRFAASSAVRAIAEGGNHGQAIPEGFTEWNIGKAAASWETNLEQVGAICRDPRYVEPAPKVVAATVGGSLSGKSFLFTGTISMPRKQAEAMVTDNGGTVASGVSKTLSFLVAGESAGSKLDKANKLGVAVLTEQEFREMATHN